MFMEGFVAGIICKVATHKEYKMCLILYPCRLKFGFCRLIALSRLSNIREIVFCNMKTRLVQRAIALIVDTLRVFISFLFSNLTAIQPAFEKKCIFRMRLMITIHESRCLPYQLSAICLIVLFYIEETPLSRACFFPVSTYVF